MRTLLTILNRVLIALLPAYGAYFAATTYGTAEAIAGFIGAEGLWTLPPLLILLAFRRNSGNGMRRAAAVATGLVIPLFVIVGPGQYSGATWATTCWVSRSAAFRSRLTCKASGGCRTRNLKLPARGGKPITPAE